MNRSIDWDAIDFAGRKYDAIAEELGVASTTVSYQARKRGIRKTRGGSRPQGDSPRTARINLILTPAEKLWIETQAEDAGVSVSALIRDLIFPPSF